MEIQTRVKVELDSSEPKELEAGISIEENDYDAILLEGYVGKPKSRKRKSSDEVDHRKNSVSDKRLKRIMLSLTRPQATLRFGADNIRVKTRDKLYFLLNKYVRQHNWVEACGALSAFLKGTCKDRSLALNRLKYLAAMELQQQTKGDHLKLNDIKKVYDIWMKKLGSMKKQPVQIFVDDDDIDTSKMHELVKGDTDLGYFTMERFAVHLEYLLLCLTEGLLEEAHQAASSMMQENDFGEDPMAYLMIGLTYSQLWYTNIPEQFQLKIVDHPHSHEESDMSESRINNMTGNLVGHDLYSHDQYADGLHQCESESSVMIDKRVPMDVDSTNGSEEPSMSDRDKLPSGSIFGAHGLESWLLPIRLPKSDESLCMYQDMFDDYYTNAVKYLRLALRSTPPASTALLPLMQLLLMADKVDEALAEVEKLCSISKAAFSFRVKASLLDCFGNSNHANVSSSFEDVLKKDPTCSHSMERLVSMHEDGVYDDESVLEMIALHLDGTFPKHNIWTKFASCFLKVSCCEEEDRLSVNENEHQDGHSQQIDYCNKIPKIFIHGKSGRNWKLRYRWWKRRHFSNNILKSEILAGDFELMAYKAACASHIYGREFNYVKKSQTVLEDNNNEDLELFLEYHMERSVGLHTKYEN